MCGDDPPARHAADLPHEDAVQPPHARSVDFLVAPPRDLVFELLLWLDTAEVGACMLVSKPWLCRWVSLPPPRPPLTVEQHKVL